MSDVRAAAQRYIDRLTEYRRLSMEAHVWAGSDETMWEGSAALRAALSGVPEGAAKIDDRNMDDRRGHFPFHEYPHTDAHTHPVPSPEPLDVERLARAQVRSGIDMFLAREERWISANDAATAVAREYARLAAPQPVPEDKS